MVMPQNCKFYCNSKQGKAPKPQKRNLLHNVFSSSIYHLYFHLYHFIIFSEVPYVLYKILI